LADAQKRALHGRQVTYLRLAAREIGGGTTVAVEPAAGELRLTGSPSSIDDAVAAIESARVQVADRTLSAFSWSDVVRLAGQHGQPIEFVLRALRAGGLDALGEVAIDGVASLDEVLGPLASTGFVEVRLHVHKAGPVAERTALWLRVVEAQAVFGTVVSLSPLPSMLSAFKPTTGYDDVKAVALARLSAPRVPHVQVDWRRYGPKLAQVALTFGADDIEGISPSDDAPQGRRRAAVEEIRRNIEAAGFDPVERTGRFAATRR
jgi:aminodeoxyfutalosine synthase